MGACMRKQVRNKVVQWNTIGNSQCEKNKQEGIQIPPLRNSWSKDTTVRKNPNSLQLIWYKTPSIPHRVLYLEVWGQKYEILSTCSAKTPSEEPEEGLIILEQRQSTRKHQCILWKKNILHKHKINCVLRRVGKKNHLILEHPLKVPHVSEVPTCSTKINTCHKKT